MNFMVSYWTKKSLWIARKKGWSLPLQNHFKLMLLKLRLLYFLHHRSILFHRPILLTNSIPMLLQSTTTTTKIVAKAHFREIIIVTFIRISIILEEIFIILVEMVVTLEIILARVLVTHFITLVALIVIILVEEFAILLSIKNWFLWMHELCFWQ